MERQQVYVITILSASILKESWVYIPMVMYLQPPSSVCVYVWAGGKRVQRQALSGAWVRVWSTGSLPSVTLPSYHSQ